MQLVAYIALVSRLRDWVLLEIRLLLARRRRRSIRGRKLGEDT